MADVTNIPQVFDTQNPARLASQLRTFAAQVQQVARKVSFEGAIWVWDDGCRTIPTNTTESGATEFVFKSAFPGDGTVIITVVGAEGGVTASLNGTNLGTMSNVDTSSEISYEFYVDNLRDTDNPLNTLKVWSTTGDSAEVRRVEIWRNHTKAAIDAVTTLAETTATNFDARNDRDGSAVTVPVVAGDGTAIDHVLNTDSTSTISLEWTWGGDESDIDGFVIYVRESSSASAYVIGTTPAEEADYYAPADKRAFFLQGVPTNKYYTFGVAAYRIVDPDVNAAGIIYSTVVQPSLSAENPYRPSANVAFQGDITGTINGTAASAVSSAVTNFNSRNDRNGTAVTNPTIATNGTAIDHVANDDGSVDISFEWSWGGTEADIDGFIIYLRNSSSSSSYNFGTTPSTETVQYVSAEKRVVFLFGVPANRYYTFGIQAYRVVDPDVDSSGILKSSIVQCTRTEEDPYQPSTTVAFAGDVTGTIDGTAAGDVNQWSAIQDDDGGKPENNASKGTVLNADFESGDVHWATTADSRVVNSPSNALSGSWCGEFTGADTDSIINDRRVPVNAGDVIFAKCFARKTGGTGGIRLMIYRYDAAGASVGSHELDSVTTVFGSYSALDGIYVVPSGTAFASVGAQATTGSSGMTGFVDAFQMHVTQKATSDALADGAVTTEKVAAKAVTDIQADSNSSPSTIPSGSAGTAVSVSITTDGSPVLLVWSAGLVQSSGGPSKTTFNLKRGGTTLSQFAKDMPTSSADYIAGQWVDTPAAGTYTYSLTVQRTGGVDDCLINDRGLSAIEFKAQ